MIQDKSQEQNSLEDLTELSHSSNIDATPTSNFWPILQLLSGTTEEKSAAQMMCQEQAVRSPKNETIRERTNFSVLGEYVEALRL